MVIESVPEVVASYITKQLKVPTIGRCLCVYSGLRGVSDFLTPASLSGIGAGAGCSGQVLVFHDMLGECRRNATASHPDED